jgi:hypothetical protein
MPDIDFLSQFANAYQGGQFFGTAVRWVVLLGFGLLLVRRLVRGSFGPGFRRSLLGTVLGLVVVVAGLGASVGYDFGADDMSSARTSIVAGCTSQGAKASVCGCYADQLLKRTDHDSEKFAALEARMVRAHKAGRAMPAAVRESVAACLGAAPDAPSRRSA